MTVPIVLFILFGAAFGLLTASRRHLFSEGPSRRPDAAERDAIAGRVTWVLVCSMLWPLMAMTGLYSLWRLRRGAARDR